ncbi:hypothetical protein [Chryseobacterium luquanense]|uniref:Uncharacterized protein n=1 Tax=Chryseobacterium luquanense TaxID=2983766 RepID=A0ABT3Y7K1_9FLAO|nr:hypothetical protein [Chryseobacterium luquanense]MCX8534098.1 hypothetical protein [Chryseobacterium luquanense]
MKSLSLKSLFIILCASVNFTFAQSTFIDKNLQFLEETAVVSQSDIKSFMKKKGFSLEDSADKFNSKLFSFKNSSDQSVMVGYTDSGKLYAIHFTVKGYMDEAEDELESKQFKMQDKLLKKSGYKYFFLIDEYKDTTTAMLLTDQYTFNKPTEKDKLITVVRLKEVLGQNNKSVKKILAEKKYFYDESLDSTKDGISEEVFIDVDYDTEIVVHYKNGQSYIVEVSDVSEKEYSNMLEWLKSKNSVKEETVGGLDKIDVYYIENDDYTVMLKYTNYPVFEPKGFALRKNR